MVVSRYPNTPRAAAMAGVVVALLTQPWNMIGIGIGAATLDPSTGSAANPSAASFSIEPRYGPVRAPTLGGAQTGPMKEHRTRRLKDNPAGSAPPHGWSGPRPRQARR
jgi:hypothetical protein